MTENTLTADRPGLLSGEPALSAASDGQMPLRDRAFLLREINITRQEILQERETFLIIINIADTKRYDDIIRCFGYKFADDLITIRLADLTFINSRQPAHRVGFWSLGFIFRAKSKNDFESALSELITLLEKPLICRGIPVSIKAGVGVCDLKLGLGAAEDLLQATFLAGQEAASSWRGWVECKYDLSEDHRRAFALISDAGHSLTSQSEFELSYQARIDILSGRCVAAEALLRWYHPTLGLVMPAEFIPLIEMTGLIKELTIWVLRRAITQAAQWHLSGYAIRACVNISPKNLEEPDFVTRLQELLDIHGLPPSHLELEFSATGSFSNIETARLRLRELRELGVSIAIDDFGIGANGFSSLEYIPANIVKIDRHLVSTIINNPRQQVLVKSMLNMARELGMQAVAEGVENADTLDLLSRWSCDFAEGYLFNRPLAADAFIQWYRQRYI